MQAEAVRTTLKGILPMKEGGMTNKIMIDALLNNFQSVFTV